MGNACDRFPQSPENLDLCLRERDENERSIDALLEQNQTLSDQATSLVSEIAGLRALRDALLSADSDEDGVPDVSDRCPGTRAVRRVDERGCSRAQRHGGMVGRLRSAELWR
jgi:hypothetical protein